MRQQRSGYFLFAVLLFAFASAAAEDLLTPEQLIDRYEISELQWSPDGQRLAMIVTEPVSEDGQARNIWMYEAEADRFRQLTWSGGSYRLPHWSPDGNTLAFLSSRDDEKTQVYLLPMNGGEAQPLTKGSTDVVDFEWSPEGNAIAFVSADPGPEPTEEEKEGKDDEIVVGEMIRPVRLRLVDIASGDTNSLIKGDWRVSAFAWRADGTGLIVSATDNFSVELLTDRLFSIGRDNKEMSELSQLEGPLSKLSVSPDDQYLAYIGSTDGGPEPHGIFLQPLKGGEARELTGKGLDRMVADFTWADDGGIWALTVDGFGSELAHLSLDGTVQQRKSFTEQSVRSFDAAGSSLAMIRASSVDPQELWVTSASGDRRISDLNEDFPALVAPQLIRYSAEDGVEVEAALFVPKNSSRPRKGWKTVLLVHGGPAGRWSYRINDWAQLLAARGFAVLAPNIRGSIGYGLDFVRANRYDWGGADYRDAIAGIDYLIDSGITDPDQLAVAGWSYGGYMSAWAITQTDRFKAAIVGAAMTDLAVEYGTETADINAYDTWYLGTPYENQDDFIRMSPMTHIKNARTPALILIGEEDEIDPIGQSRQFYRGLKRYDVETELVIYPREPHGIKERSHRIDLLTRLTGWIETYTR